MKQKMLYASSKEALRKALVGIAAEIQGTDLSEVSYGTGMLFCERLHHVANLAASAREGVALNLLMVVACSVQHPVYLSHIAQLLLCRVMYACLRIFSCCHSPIPPSPTPARSRSSDS